MRGKSALVLKFSIAAKELVTLRQLSGPGTKHAMQQPAFSHLSKHFYAFTLKLKNCSYSKNRYFTNVTWNILLHNSHILFKPHVVGQYGTRGQRFFNDRHHILTFVAN